MAASRPRVTAAVCAHNEAANIGALLATLLSRDRDCFDELIVLSSASTDGTDEIVRALAATDDALRLITEPVRAGKVSAVNRAMQEAAGEVLLLIDADCLPAPGALAVMIARFAEAAVGGVGSRNTPVNGDAGWVARAGAVLWELHHIISLRDAVLGGDIAAFRRVIPELASTTVNDDYAIEVALREAGLRVVYEPRGKVLMRVPTTVRDFVRQRRRIYAGYRAETRAGMVKATQDPRRTLAAIFHLVKGRPGVIPSLTVLLALDLLSRTSIVADALFRKRPYYTAWEPAASTKGPLPQTGPWESAP